VDENEYVTVCVGDGGADGSTDDGSGLVTIDDCGLAILTAGGIVTGDAVVGNNTAGAADDAAGASDVYPVLGAFVDDGMPMLFVEADGAAVDDAADASDADAGTLVPLSADDADATLGDDVAPVDDVVLVPLSAVDADGATVDDTNWISVDGGSVDGADDALVDEGSVDAADGAAVDEEISAVDADGATGIMIPMLVGDADGATGDGWISVDDTNWISFDGGSVDGAEDALVDEGSVDAADGAAVDEEISVRGELELFVLVPVGGRVVDAVASIVPGGAGTC